jgi:hypothetical protein
MRQRTVEPIAGGKSGEATAGSFGTVGFPKTLFFHGNTALTACIRVALAVALSCGLAVVMFSFAFIAKHFGAA